MENTASLEKAIIELDEVTVYELVDLKMAAQQDPIEIIKECNLGMVGVGNLFEQEEYFLSELLMAGEIFKNVMSKLQPMLSDGDELNQYSNGTVVLGTVKDDIHDIGKDIVLSLLKGTGFNVVDLGVDVPAEKFVAAVRETGAKVVGISCLLNFTFVQMKNIVDELVKAGLRDQVKIMIGGAPVNEDVLIFTGADYYGKDATSAVTFCNKVYLNN